jgi:hypothetical protein
LLGNTLLTRWLGSTRTAEIVHACALLQIRPFPTCATSYTLILVLVSLRKGFMKGRLVFEIQNAQWGW